MSRSGRASALMTVGIVVMLTSSCVHIRPLVDKAGSQLRSPLARENARRADNAAIVMTRIRTPYPAAWAASTVVGATTGAQIEALLARGTTWDGRVVLRITTTNEGTRGQFGTPDSLARCYSYTFTPTDRFAKPLGIDCPSTPALVLPSPPPPPSFDATAVTRLKALLKRMPRQTLDDATELTRRIAQVFGPPSYVTAGPSGKDTFVEVRFDPQCLLAYVRSTGAVEVKIGLREDCTGG